MGGERLNRCSRMSLRSSGLRVATRWTSLSHAQPHHFERGVAERAVGIAERLADLEVVVVAGNDQLDRLARRLQGGGEIPRLALEFRRLQGAVEHRHRAVDAVEM